MTEPDLFEQADPPRRISLGRRRAAVLALLQDGRWHSTAEINHPDVGGSEGTRRLRELRAQGFRILRRRRRASDQFEYCLQALDG